MFSTTEKKLFGACAVEYGNIQWRQLHASDSEGNYIYRIKTVIIGSEIQEKKPFGPQTASVLAKRAQESVKCLFNYYYLY
jgi:hypothetical protein